MTLKVLTLELFAEGRAVMPVKDARPPFKPSAQCIAAIEAIEANGRLARAMASQIWLD